MTASFYNNKAGMVGIDFHHAQLLSTALSELAKGHRKDDWPYLVVVKCSWFGGDEGKRTPNVTADAEKMIRDGFVIGKVPHVPMPGPLHPYEAVELASIISASKTTPLLKMSTVTSSSDPLSVCAIGPVGANLNCQEGGDLKLTGIVFCECSVVTSPSLKDLIFRIFDDYIKKWLIDKIIDIIDLILKWRKVPKLPRAIIKWLLKKLVPKLVDLMEDLAKWLWDKAEAKAREPKKLPPKEEPQKPREDPKEKERKEQEKQIEKWKEQERQERWDREKDKWKHWPAWPYAPWVPGKPPPWYR
ncbi:hypothetical protein A7982_12987 [Minicystis rosea]|nr:hypothetical protein A7982_12987 [Minicystis rosea]